MSNSENARLGGGDAFYKNNDSQSICMPTRRKQKQIRNVTGDDSDKPELLDVLPANEFSVNERLPPLPPPIIRRTIFVSRNNCIDLNILIMKANEGERLLLDCSNQDGNSLIWRKNMEELNGTRILDEARRQWILDDRPRRILTAQGRLIIELINKEDAGLYS